MKIPTSNWEYYKYIITDYFEGGRRTPLWKALLVEHRIPHRLKSWRNFKNEYVNFFFRQILKTPPTPCNPHADVDYFTIICHAHTTIYIASIKSFLRFYGNVRIVAADDGTLTKYDIKLLKEHIPGIKIFDKNFLNNYIKENVKSEFLLNLKKRDPSQIKIIDVNLLCKKRKMLIDSDVLFIKRPDEIIDWIENPEAKPFYHTEKNIENRESDLTKHFPEPNPGINIQYYFKKNLEKINQALGTNITHLIYCAGVIGYNEKLTLEQIEHVQKILLSFAPEGYEPWGVEQCAYGFLFKEKSERLNDKYYFATEKNPSDEDVKNAKMIHFIGKLAHKKYLTLFHKLLRELND